MEKEKKAGNKDWSGTWSGFMRETRSEGCHLGKTVSGTARMREEGGAAEVRREALEKEGVLLLE